MPRNHTALLLAAFAAATAFAVAGVSAATAAPRLVGQTEPLPGYPRDVRVGRNVVFVAAAEAGLRGIDVSDSAHPREVSAVAGWWVGASAAIGDFEPVDLPGGSLAVDVDQRIAYVADTTLGVVVVDAASRDGGLFVLSVGG